MKMEIEQSIARAKGSPRNVIKACPALTKGQVGFSNKVLWRVMQGEGVRFRPVDLFLRFRKTP